MRKGGARGSLPVDQRHNHDSFQIKNKLQESFPMQSAPRVASGFGNDPRDEHDSQKHSVER